MAQGDGGNGSLNGTLLNVGPGFPNPIRLRRVSLAGQLLKKCRSRLPAHMYSYVHKHNVGAQKSQSGAILNTPRIFVTSQRRENRYNRIPFFAF